MIKKLQLHILIICTSRPFVNVRLWFVSEKYELISIGDIAPQTSIHHETGN